MSAMSIYATLASQEALAGGRARGATELGSGRLGVAIGSTVGSTQATEDFFRDFFTDSSLERMKSTLFFQIMNHSCAANVAQALGITGRLLAPSAACSTGCQAVGYGFEQVAMRAPGFDALRRRRRVPSADRGDLRRHDRRVDRLQRRARS